MAETPAIHDLRLMTSPEVEAALLEAFCAQFSATFETEEP